MCALQYCLRLLLGKEESQELFGRLKKEKLSITYATAAATILGVKQCYEKGHETGALLGMTRNARRWVETDGGNSAPIPVASDVVFLWIPFPPGLFQKPLAEQVRLLGHEVKTQLSPHLSSPHYISSMQFVCDTVLQNLNLEHQKEEALKKAGNQAYEADVAPSAPGFSPQGVYGLERSFEHNGAFIERLDFVHTGRQVCASPWAALASMDGIIRLSIGCDTKYYRSEKIDRFMHSIRENLRAFLHASGQTKL